MSSYRREIDGLRAVAVLPVVFFHAGLAPFSGGYVGVDVFFVISGYLITSIIREGLRSGSFSILTFYVRRIRRILPALFLVMAVSAIFAARALMPDELKNFGQSLVATTFSSNNLLLAVTSGYWDLASEFKPLLHTWSLGVEEQYYLLAPFLLMMLWKTGSPRKTPMVFGILFLASALSMIILTEISPNWTFYSLPTRAWEILLGALVAILMEKLPNGPMVSRTLLNTASAIGLLAILAAILTFNEATPGLLMLVPTFGAAAIILFTREGGAVYWILSRRPVVFVGLLSYSIYLWHQPVFAFLRAVSVEKPSWYIFLLLVIPIVLLAYLSWRFVERPVRDRRKIDARAVVGASACLAISFTVAGLVLNSSYGLLRQIYGSEVAIADMDKRIYNERVFSYQKEQFTSDNRKKLLVVGNSFARDFVNITLEHFDTTNVEIVYRSDLSQCVYPYRDTISKQLVSSAEIIVFASGDYETECVMQDLRYAAEQNKRLYFVGSKDFGFNLNWLRWLDRDEWRNRYNPLNEHFILADEEMSTNIPNPHYISLLKPVLEDSHKVPITDDAGRLLSTDRKHLTRFGAIYFGNQAVGHTHYASNFP
jgi:peptidoglycan/LPS O-acetylase OafA/YrhL